MQGVLSQSSARVHPIAGSSHTAARFERIAAGPRLHANRTAGIRSAAPLASRSGRHLRLQVCAAVKRFTLKNVACSKTLTVLPGKEAAAEELCRDAAIFSRQRAADRENGILGFDCSKEVTEEGATLLHFWELYESNAAMGRHNTTPEMSTFMSKIQPLCDGPVGMALYEMKDGKLGMASVQGGPRGEGGLDDATGASGAAGGASYKQTSSTVDLTNVGVDEEKEERGLWGIKFELPWAKKKKE